jgi:iron complex outermembrane receptor protein
MAFRKFLWMGTVSSLALACSVGAALAADTAAPEEIVVTGGYLKSLQDAIETKRQADGVVEAVSASDIGMLPDKNVADALQRLPGISTQTSAAAGAGGFGENDRVSIRGTAPNLTQTLINGHAVGTGDWFILDQLDAASRSVTFSMFPSEIVDHAVVYKSSQADQVEGGTAGTIDIVTRNPLGFKDQYTGEVQLGGAYSDLAAKAGYQFNGLVNWKNDANTFGVMLQGFDEDRFLRRDGQEVLGYTTIPNTAAWPTALRGVTVPSIINNALFTQERHRMGGNVAVEYAPSDKWDFKVDGFLSRLLAGNFNQGDLIDVADEINKGVVPTAYTVSNNALTSATFPGSAGIGNPGINDISRPHAASYSEYINADGTWKPTSSLKVHFSGGYTQGEGKTDQLAYGTTAANTSFSYGMNGTNPITTSFPGATGLNNPANYAAFNGDGNQDWVGLTQLAQLDREGYGQVDVNYYLDAPIVNEVDAGFRYTEHNRHETVAENYGCYSGVCTPSLASIGNGSFPSNFGSGAGISAPFNLSVNQNALDALVSQMIASTGKTAQQRVFGGGPYGGAFFDITEDTAAGYAMARIGGTNWKGNVGVRIVNTKDDINTYDSVPENPSIKGVTYSDFGPWYVNPHSQNYTDILPSLSLSYDIAKDQEVHLSAAQTMTRPDYYALAGGITLNDSLLTGTVGNPNLRPTRSNNFDLSWEWYYAPKSMVSVALFNMRMESDFDAVTTNQVETDLQLTQSPNNPGGLANPVYRTYSVQTTDNNSGYSRGVELSWQQPIAYGFGGIVNYTYTDSAQDNPTPGIGGHTMLGAARHRANVTAYYEDGALNAHLSYTRHSSIYQGIDRGNKYFEDDGGSLDGSINYAFTKNFSANVDVLNIADEKDVYVTGALPRATYDFGRTIYFSLNAKY